MENIIKFDFNKEEGIKLGMTGSRMGMTEKAEIILKKFLNNNIIIEAHHGDCIGADEKFHEIVLENKIKTIIHPPKNNTMRSFCKGDEIRKPLDYIQRNHSIVNETDMLIAFPSTKTEIIRSGSWATIRYAKKNKKPILIIFTDGTTQSY